MSGQRGVGLGIVAVVGLRGWIRLLIAATNWPLRPIWVVILAAWSLGIAFALHDIFLATQKTALTSQ